MTSRHKQWRLAAASVALALAVVACAETPAPTAQIRSAREAIARAEENGAKAIAPEPLQMAQNKLDAAQSAVQQKEMDKAAFMAEEAEADADLASATANAQRVSNTAEQLQGAQRRAGQGQ